jgi:hypothetical protein
MSCHRTLAAIVSIAILSCSAAAFGAGGIVVPGNGKGGYNQPEAPPTKMTLKYVQQKTAPLKGKPHLALQFTFVEKNHPGMLIAFVGWDEKKNEPMATVETAAEHLKEGDIVNVELKKMEGYETIVKLTVIELKRGEDTPHGYVFQESYNDPKGSGAAIVRLTKYGKYNSIEAVIPFTKDDKNQAQPDPDLVAAVGALKEGDSVYANLVPMSGKAHMLTMIMPYKESQTGKVTKVTEPTGEAAKTQGSEIEITTDDGKTVTAQVPGKTINKHFVPDPMLKGIVHSLKKDNEVIFLTRTDNGKDLLVELSRAPAAPKNSGKSSTADKSEKMDKDNGGVAKKS